VVPKNDAGYDTPTAALETQLAIGWFALWPVVVNRRRVFESGSGPRMCQSTNRQPHAAYPDVCFRVVHVTIGERVSSATPASHDFEVAIGPPGSNILRRLHPRPAGAASGNASRRSRRRAGPKRGAGEALKKAIRWQEQLDSGAVASRAEISRREGLTRARVTQIMNLLQLAPAVRSVIESEQRDSRWLTERALRQIAGLTDRRRQILAFRALTQRSSA
jgi:hypothetical protein